jgi:hypothetical protein
MTDVLVVDGRLLRMQIELAGVTSWRRVPL